jgi:hypothetical protein
VRTMVLTALRRERGFMVGSGKGNPYKPAAGKMPAR